MIFKQLNTWQKYSEPRLKGILFKSNFNKIQFKIFINLQTKIRYTAIILLKIRIDKGNEDTFFLKKCRLK